MTNSQPDCMTYSQPVPNSSRSQQSPYCIPQKRSQLFPQKVHAAASMKRNQYLQCKDTNIQWLKFIGVFFSSHQLSLCVILPTKTISKLNCHALPNTIVLFCLINKG